MYPTRIYVLFFSSFRYERAPNISHETADSVKTFCGRAVSEAATVEPDANNLEPDCRVCRRVAAARRANAEAARCPRDRVVTGIDADPVDIRV